jgi:acetyltransferase
LVHDFPYRSLPGEVETALTVTEPLLAATAARPGILPVIVSLTSGEPTAEVHDRARSAGGVPVLRGAVEAFTAIAALARWEARQERRAVGVALRPEWPALAADRMLYGHDPKAPSAVPHGEDRAATALPELESLEWLAAAGLPIVHIERAATPGEAIAKADAIGYPVVVKIDAVGLAHKSDVGAVRVGLRDGGAVRAAATELLNMELPDGATRRGILVASHLEGVELIVGARRDPSFGPLVLAGLGGIFAEVLDDVAIRLAPVAADDAAAMLDQLRGRRLLGPLRGRPGIDRSAVVDAIVRIGLAICATPEVVEIDINPLISAPDRTAAADGLVVMRR